MRALVVAVLVLAAATVDRSEFRFVRELAAPAGGPVVIEPDGPLYAHARVGFGDLRIVDADGAQVPWRPAPVQRAQTRRILELLNRGREGAVAVALIDLGRDRGVYDRIEVETPDRDFVGRCTVLGSDTREGRFARLGTTPIYDVAGAEGRARSTTVVFSPTDFRYLQLRATGISAIGGATVFGASRERGPRRVRAEAGRTELDRSTRLVLDFRWANTPVDELRIRAATARYDREVLVEASEAGASWEPVAFGRAVHFPGSVDAPLIVESRQRYLRLTIFNGDDTPLAGLEIEALARPRLLLAEEGHSRPYRLLYGSSTVDPPSYDFARLPASALPSSGFVRGRLGPERRNAAFDPPEDTRSFTARHPELVQAALAVAALAVAVVGFLVLRRRSS